MYVPAGRCTACRGRWLYSAAAGDGVKGVWANSRRGPGGLGRFRTVSSRRILEGFLMLPPATLQCCRKPAESEPQVKGGQRGVRDQGPGHGLHGWVAVGRDTTDGPDGSTRETFADRHPVACSRTTALAREISTGGAGPAAVVSPVGVARRTARDSRAGWDEAEAMASRSIGHAAPPRFAACYPGAAAGSPRGSEMLLLRSWSGVIEPPRGCGAGQALAIGPSSRMEALEARPCAAGAKVVR